LFFLGTSESRIIKFNKDLEIEDGIIAARSSKFDKITVKDADIWVCNCLTNYERSKKIKRKYEFVAFNA